MSSLEASPRERNRRGEGARLRADILAAARELLDEGRDDRDVTLRAVARKIGIAAPSIYKHFPDQSAIMLAVVVEAFEDLTLRLRAARDAAGADALQRLRAVCDAYLDYAQQVPQRYRVMFGGVWDTGQALSQQSITREQLSSLGEEALGVLAEALGAAVAAGYCTSTDLFGDAVALWLGLHGLAHQRAVTSAFPWPTDIVDRIVVPLIHLTAPPATTATV
jgi:AcrR family transcriptional regulator